MKTIYSVHLVVYIAMALVILPTYLFSAVAYIAYEEADHIASYTVTRNSIDFCSATIFPFTGLAALLVTLVDHRAFEIDAVDIDFEPNFHQHPKLSSSRAKKTTPKKQSQQQQKQTKDLTIKLL